MNISSLDCKYLQVDSSVYRQLVLNNKLASIKVEGKINDEDWVEQTLTYPQIVNTWTLNNIPISNSVSIISFNFKNIFTGEEYNILSSPFTIGSVSAVNSFKAIVAQKFLNLFNTTISQTSVISYSGEEPVSFNYTISSIPFYLSAYTIESNTDGIISENYLIPTSVSDIALSLKSIFVLPSFFELENNYTDSIISLRITLTSTTNIVSVEETCYFMDCTFKCLLPSIQNFECIEQGTSIAMLHYSLTQASNCDCECSDMYEIFKYLQKKLSFITDNNEDCGC